MVMMVFVSADDPYTTITEPAFTARFLLDPRTDAADTVTNVDVFVDLPGGSTWALTISAVDEVRRLSAQWKETGDAANGSYFWVADRVLVPEPGVSAMTAAIRELVRSDEIDAAGDRCDEGARDFAAANTE